MKKMAWSLVAAVLALLLMGALDGCKKSDTSGGPVGQGPGAEAPPEPGPAPVPAAVPPENRGPEGSGEARSSATVKPAPAKLFWNVWAEDRGAMVRTIAAETTPSVVLDLSKYQYQRDYAAAPATGVGEAVAEALAARRKTLTLIVRTALLGGGSSVELDVPAEQSLSLDLQRYRNINEQIFERDRKRALAGGSRNVPAELSRLHALGSLRVPLRVRASPDPCVQISFTVWDAQDSRPLDHLVFTLSTGAPPKDGKVCGVSILQGGLGAMAGALTSNGEAKADAALYLFEYEPARAPVRTRAILVALNKHPENGPPTVYNWTIPGQLTNYLNSPAFQKGIAKARSRKKYDQMSAELKNKFFPFDRTDPANQSRSAFDALAHLESKAAAPLLIVRYISVHGKQIYAPLGILNASDAVSRKFGILYPLPRESYSTTQCVARWALGFPKKLSDASLLDWDKDTMTIPPDRATRIEDMKQLKCYLQTDEPGCDKPPPHGGGSDALLLLAHHSEGLLWFQDSDDDLDRMAIEAEQRVFPPGSVAFLSACSVLNSSLDNDKLLTRLNDYGMDAIVASPFAVSTEYGVLLSKKIIEVLAEAYAANRSMSVLDIFQGAVEKIKADPANGPAFDQMHYEFVVLGNHRIKICN